MFGRMWSLDIDGEVFVATTDKQSLKIEFDVTVSMGNTLSFTDIRITNLAKGSSIKQDASITLSAGYKDNYDVIFKGTVTNVLKERNGADTVIRLLCRSGVAGSDRMSCTSSYGRGASVIDIIRDLAKAWPRQLEIDENQFIDAPRFISGYAVDGDIPTVLNELKYAYNFEWNQHNGRLTITKPTARRNTEITEVNKFTGMVGMPEVNLGPNGLGIFVVVALNPQMAVNGRINVTSEYSTFNTGNLYFSENTGDATANGEYNIMAMRHRGDSHSGQWTTEIQAIRPGILSDKGRSNVPTTYTAPDVPTPKSPSDGTLIWGERVNQDFRIKVKQVAGRLGFDPNWLMAVMAFETGRSFSSSMKNPKGSATGLIQFTESTAQDLGTTTRDLARMNAVDQLDYVEKYYSKYKKAINNLGDCYMKVLYPVAMGKPDSYVMWVKDNPVTGKYYNANPNLDTNKNNQITRGEAVSRVNNEMKEGMRYSK